MKTSVKFLGAALLALFTASCIEHTATIRLNKDGSGTITEETLFSAEATAMFSQIPAGGDSPTAKFADKEEAAKNAAALGEGVTVVKAEEIAKDGRAGGRVVYAFKDINKVKFSFGKPMSDAGKDMAPPGGALDDAKKAADAESVRFVYKDGVLKLANPATKAEKKEPVGEGDDKPGEGELPGAQELAMMQQMFKDMRMTFKIEIADGIAETNASHVDGDTVTLIDMPMGKLLSDPEQLKKLNAMKDNASPAETAAAFKGIEGVKIETREEITVKVK